MRNLLVVVFVAFTIACQGSGEGTPGAPVPAKRGFTASSDGTRIAYTVTGTGPTTLMLLHGWSCDRSYWDHQVATFSPDYQVVTVDLGGHGDSGRDREDWTVASLASDVEAVATSLKLERIVIVGHSMGGPVALVAAAAMPERVIGVVGADTLQDAEWKTDAQQRQELLDGFEKDFPGSCDRFVRSMFRPSADPDLVSRTAGGMCSAPPEIAVPLLASVLSFDAAAALGAAKVPVRCVNSDMWATNVEGNRKYADFDAVVLEGTGHFLMLERPKEFDFALGKMVGEIVAARPPSGASGS